MNSALKRGFAGPLAADGDVALLDQRFRDKDLRRRDVHVPLLAVEIPEAQAAAGLRSDKSLAAEETLVGPSPLVVGDGR